MKDRQKSLIILMLLTGVIGLVTTIIGLSLQNNSTAPQIFSATCPEGKIRCSRDNPGLCLGFNGSSAIGSNISGQECLGGESWGPCQEFAACAPDVVQSQTQCSGNYPELGLPIIRISEESSENGSFVGCAYEKDTIQNCFCAQNVPINATFQSGVVNCIPAGVDLCGQRDFVPTSKEASSSSPTPSVTVVSTIASTPTATPTSTPTPTFTPTSSPTAIVTTLPDTSYNISNISYFALLLLLLSVYLFRQSRLNRLQS